MMRGLRAAAAFVSLLAEAMAADSPVAFEGTITVTLTHSGQPAKPLLYTRKGARLRIEIPDKRIPEPINIVELDSGRLTILYPHNSTFVRTDSARVVAGDGEPGSRSALIPNPAGVDAAGYSGRRMAMPSMPPMPMMMPGMPARGGTPELQKKEGAEKRKIHGLECQAYEIKERAEVLEIWAPPDSALFPFRVLQRDYSMRRFGPAMLEDLWPELLQKKSLFPFEATLRMESSDKERFSFKVEKIEKKKIEDASLFEVPAKFHEIQPPPF